MSNVQTMSFEQKLEEAVKAAQAIKEQEYEKTLQFLIENPAFIEAQRSLAAKSSELKELEARISQLNAISPFVAKDGTKYRITCYQINEFGPGMAQILGIINASKGAFTEDLALQYSAICGVSTLELAQANAALGSPTYITKAGLVSPAVLPDLTTLKPLVASIMLKMGIQEFSPELLTQDKLDIWLLRAELAVARQQEERKLTEQINVTSKFTLED